MTVASGDVHAAGQTSQTVSTASAPQTATTLTREPATTSTRATLTHGLPAPRCTARTGTIGPASSAVVLVRKARPKASAGERCPGQALTPAGRPSRRASISASSETARKPLSRPSIPTTGPTPTQNGSAARSSPATRPSPAPSSRATIAPAGHHQHGLHHREGHARDPQRREEVRERGHVRAGRSRARRARSQAERRGGQPHHGHAGVPGQVGAPPLAVGDGPGEHAGARDPLILVLGDGAAEADQA